MNTVGSAGSARRGSRRRNTPVAIMLAVVMAFGILASVAGAEAAGGNVAKGCQSKSITQKWKLGYTFYGLNYSFRWCWTKGTSSTVSKNYNITGAAYPWANSPNQQQNGVGPTNSARVPISSSWKDSNGSTMVYFWFQTRSCLTGKLDLVCSSWVWHKIKLELKSGGTFATISRT